MNFVGLFKAVDALVALRDATRRFKRPETDEPAVPPPAVQGLSGQIETRLTNVVVAALKEAFDRDHARLELERSHLEEERRRAEGALRAELRRQSIERELGSLRLIASGAMLGWIASIVLLAGGLVAGGWAGRSVLLAAWSLLLASLGFAVAGQRNLAVPAADDGGAARSGAAGNVALWLLIAGLAMTGVSMLL